jgi:apolipoprotein N-acyltransferase
VALFIWNVLTTWWVGKTYWGTHDWSSALAGVFANSANPLLMCIPMMAFHGTKKKFGHTIGYVSLIAYWLTFEFIHLRWDLTWPWLTLGNGFACNVWMIQWYEYTGTPGGSLWILLLNILIFEIANAFFHGRTMVAYRKKILIATGVLVLPVIVSLIIYNSYQEKGKPQEVVVIQPNIDPYNEKFDPAALNEQMQKLLNLTNQSVDDKTDYVVWPETSIPTGGVGFYLPRLKQDSTLSKIRDDLRAFPQITLIAGINCFTEYATDATPTARYEPAGNFYWDVFNSAIQIDSSDAIPVYHKSKLVPGVEKMPYPQLFKFLAPLAINMGGISGSLGSQANRSVFFSHDSIGVGPMICYESVYGEYATEYVRRGANLFFVITNDGWWENTAGHKQHLEYGALRAIETRRDIAQSANTGTSAFINQRGDISQQTPWWQACSIHSTLYANSAVTFYVRYGDYISRMAILVAVLILLYSVFFSIRKRIQNS